jgi:hypothetical protein
MATVGRSGIWGAVEHHCNSSRALSGCRGAGDTGRRTARYLCVATIAAAPQRIQQIGV